MRLTLELPAPTLAAAQDSRTVAGTLIPYGIRGRTSIGDVTVRPGAVRVPDGPLSRVRLLRGHDREHPIGVLAELTDTETELRGRFTVARTPEGEAYLAELDPDAPIRDGLSVELDDVTVTAGEVTAGTLLAVAAVPLPAFSPARATLAAELTDPDPIPDPPSSTTEENPMPDTITDEPTPAEPAPPPAPAVELSASWNAVAPQPARTRPVSAVRDLAERLCAARMDGSQAMRAALADITPTGNGAGNEQAGLTVQALGELWDGITYTPRYLPLVNLRDLTGIEISGWVWDPAPEVDDYAGDKADIPSNAAKLELRKSSASRLAGGHDIDRVYRDLGTPEVLASYWAKMADDLARKLDAKAMGAIVTAAGTPGSAATLTEARIAGTLAVSTEGAASYCLAASDVITAHALTTTADAPVGVPGMTLPEIMPAPELSAGTVLVGIRQAVRFHTFRPPVRLEAVNIPNGGIDAALFSYWAALTDNAAGVVAYTVTPAVAAGGAGRGRRGE